MLWGGLFPPWSFLPIGIGERPANDSLAFGGLISLHSLSFLWVSGRRRRGCLILAMPPASYAGEAFSVLAMLGAINLLTLAFALTWTLTLVYTWGATLAVAESLRSRPRHPRGISRMADGTFPHLT